MKCPVCASKVEAKFTKSGRNHKTGLMLICAEDSRHFRAFINDPRFLKQAHELDDPAALITASADTQGQGST